MPILALDHVQIAMPPGREAEARAFYGGLLGLAEDGKPPNLAARGGCWFAAGAVKVHLGVEAGFAPARKAHPAFRVDDLADLVERLQQSGHPCTEDKPLVGTDRRYVQDPFGNRIELMQLRPTKAEPVTEGILTGGTPIMAEDDDRTLVLSRLIAAPPATLYRCWTEADLLKRWFAPAPWTVPEAELDVRPGGANLVVMRGPDGNAFPSRGVYLEVVPNEKLVFTDAYTSAWEPSQTPFMTVIVTFAPEGQGTRYVATVRHWTAEGRAQHEAMGFHDGWGRCADQLAEVAKGL